MKRPLTTSVLLGFAFLGFFIFTSSICTGQPSPKELFIFKSYGDMKPKNEGVCNIPIAEESYWGKEFNCGLIYGPGEINSQTIPVNTVSIRIYKTEDAAKNEMNRIWTRNINKSNSKYTVSGLAGKDRVISRNSTGIKSATWVSNDKIISVASNVNSTVSEEIVNDYLSKHPPTFTFKAEDLDIQKVMKKEISKKFITIDDFENKRKGLIADNQKEIKFNYMVAQCREEMYIQCLYNNLQEDGTVGCPITKNLDDQDRNKKWNELKKKVREEVVVDNISWHYMNEPKCPIDKNYEEEILRSLGIDIEDLMK